jgi:hypothetical protein
MVVLLLLMLLLLLSTTLVYQIGVCKPSILDHLITKNPTVVVMLCLCVRLTARTVVNYLSGP